MKSVPLCLAWLIAVTPLSSPIAQQAAAREAAMTTMQPANPDEIATSIRKAMEWLHGQENSGQGLQYADYVVFCGQEVVKLHPKYAEVVEGYKHWVIKNDRFYEKLPYQAACSVMGLDLAGSSEKAAEFASKLLPLANEGQWHVPYHIGWYLYACLVAGDTALAEATFGHLQQLAAQPEKYQYFTAYCLWKIYEKTGEERYKDEFLVMAERLKAFRTFYFNLAKTDGHGGMALTVFARAFSLSKDAGQLEIADEMARLLLASQGEDGSWNGKTAYTIMPAEGLASYLKFCRGK